jgi:hypothetical protein
MEVAWSFCYSSVSMLLFHNNLLPLGLHYVMIVTKPKVVGICDIDFNFLSHIKYNYSCCLEFSFHVGCNEPNYQKLIF